MGKRRTKLINTTKRTNLDLNKENIKEINNINVFGKNSKNEKTNLVYNNEKNNKDEQHIKEVLSIASNENNRDTITNVDVITNRKILNERDVNGHAVNNKNKINKINKNTRRSNNNDTILTKKKLNLSESKSLRNNKKYINNSKKNKKLEDSSAIQKQIHIIIDNDNKNDTLEIKDTQKSSISTSSSVESTYSLRKRKRVIEPEISKPRVRIQNKKKELNKKPYKLRSSDKKLEIDRTSSTKKNIKSIAASRTNEKHIIIINENKTKRLSNLFDDNKASKINKIFSSLPLFISDDNTKNENNDKYDDDSHQEYDSELEIIEEEKENESSDNETYINDHHSKENKNESESHRIKIPKEELDNIMEETLYNYISKNKSQSKLKNYMNVLKFLKDPLANFPYDKVYKNDYYYTCTDTPLSTQKEYLTCGFYSEEFRLGTKKRKLSSYNDIQLHNNEIKKNFKFPTIMYYGDFILNEQTDFRLPPDIYLLSQDPHFKKMLSQVPTKGPSKFKHISQNIYLDVKPKKVYNGECNCKKGDNCGESCWNRSLFVECNPLHCPCGDKCTNQRFHRYDRKSKKLKVFWANEKGYGLKTEKPIKKDELIIEYTGEVMSNEKCRERLKTIYKDMNSFYFIGFDVSTVIDACQKGSVARFANHSCNPNCHIEKWVVDDKIRVGLFALRDIEANEELLYDYNFYSYGEQQKCNCGSKNCRGIIDHHNQNNNSEVKPLNKKKKSKIVTSNINLNKYWIIKHKWELLIKEMKDIINNKMFLTKNRIFLIRNIKHANKDLIKQSYSMFNDRKLVGYINYTKSYNHQYQLLLKELREKYLPKKVEQECVINKFPKRINNNTLIQYLKRNEEKKEEEKELREVKKEKDEENKSVYVSSSNENKNKEINNTTNKKNNIETIVIID